jgi:hypothetical protein
MVFPAWIVPLRKQESRVPRIHLISQIAGIQGGFANTLVIGMRTDNAGKVNKAGDINRARGVLACL